MLCVYMNFTPVDEQILESYIIYRNLYDIGLKRKYDYKTIIIKFV